MNTRLCAGVELVDGGVCTYTRTPLAFTNFEVFHQFIGPQDIPLLERDTLITMLVEALCCG